MFSDRRKVEHFINKNTPIIRVNMQTLMNRNLKQIWKTCIDKDCSSDLYGCKVYAGLQPYNHKFMPEKKEVTNAITFKA